MDPKLNQILNTKFLHDKTWLCIVYDLKNSSRLKIKLNCHIYNETSSSIWDPLFFAMDRLTIAFFQSSVLLPKHNMPFTIFTSGIARVLWQCFSTLYGISLCLEEHELKSRSRSSILLCLNASKLNRSGICLNLFKLIAWYCQQILHMIGWHGAIIFYFHMVKKVAPPILAWSDKNAL